MELPDLLAALRKRWFVLVVLGLLGAGYGYYQVSQAEPVYRSTSKVFVSLTRGDTVAELVQGSTYTQNLVSSFAQLATMPVVLDPVIEKLGLTTSWRALAGRIQADAVMDAVIIEISASNTDPARAADVANAVADQLSETVRTVTPTTSDGSSSVQMTVVSRAEPARLPYAPSKRTGIGLPAVGGLALGFVIALLWSRLDTRVRSPKDFPSPPERPVLGQIVHDRRLRDLKGRALAAHPHGAYAESYRRMRTNLQYVDASAHVRAVVVTSSIPGEGKSTTALNLAITLAEKHVRVLLVDADLRRPSIATLTGLEGSVGLSTVIVGEAALEDVAHAWGSEYLHVVPAGGTPPNPSQLIDSDAMGQFLAEAQARYEIVVIDTPPMLALADAAILAKRTDGAIVVAGARKVRRAQLAETLSSLDAIGVPIIGLVANGVRNRGQERYGYGYGDLADLSPWGRFRRRLARTFKRRRRATPSMGPGWWQPESPGATWPTRTSTPPTRTDGPAMTTSGARSDVGGDD